MSLRVAKILCLSGKVILAGVPDGMRLRSVLLGNSTWAGVSAAGLDWLSDWFGIPDSDVDINCFVYCFS